MSCVPAQLIDTVTVTRKCLIFDLGIIITQCYKAKVKREQNLGKVMLTSLSCSILKMQTVLSNDPDAKRLPSKFQSTECTFAEWAGISRTLS